MEIFVDFVVGRLVRAATSQILHEHLVQPEIKYFQYITIYQSLDFQFLQKNYPHRAPDTRWHIYLALELRQYKKDYIQSNFF